MDPRDGDGDEPVPNPHACKPVRLADDDGDAPAPSLLSGKSVRFSLVVVGMVLVTGLALVAMLQPRRAPAPKIAAAPPAAMKVTAPARPAKPAQNVLTYGADHAGHYLVEASVNGARIRFLVDTGATMVALTPEDAQAAGLSGASLTYSLRMNTAHGEAKAARATLREVRLGQLSVEDVPAVVMEEDMPVSLLGMSFLNRLNGYSIKDGVLTIEW